MKKDWWIVEKVFYLVLILLQMGKYRCKCIAPGCIHIFLVETNTLEEAIQKIIDLSDEHNYKFHPEMPIVSDEKMRRLLVRIIEKVE